MTQKQVILGYLSLMTLISTTLGGYVACGAQKYRVPVHGNEPENGGKRPNTNTSAQTSGQGASGTGANLFGVHSSKGWARSLPIRYRASSEFPPEVVAELRNAMKTWETALGKQVFVYDGTEDKKGADFKELYEPLNDGNNGHYFDFNWQKATGKSNTVLATTIWENDPRDPTSIVKADIRYNAEFYIFGDALKEYSEGKRTIVDMESLALHEVGHLLGLTHVAEKDDRYSVMNASLFIGEGMMTRRLSEGDIERVRTIYGVGDATLASTLEKADDFPTQN